MYWADENGMTTGVSAQGHECMDIMSLRRDSKVRLVVFKEGDEMKCQASRER